MRPWVLIAAFAAGSLPAPLLHAQAPRRHRVMLGPALNSVHPFDGDVGKDLGPGLIVRGVPRKGLGPVVDLSFMTLDLKQPGEPSPLGSLRLRTLLAGIGYTFENGRLATTLALAGGYSLVKADTRALAVDGQTARFDVSSAPLVRTTVTLTWSAWRRVALTSSVGAVFVEPEVTLRFDDPSGRPPETGTWRAHSFIWQVGAAYKLF